MKMTLQSVRVLAFSLLICASTIATKYSVNSINYNKIFVFPTSNSINIFCS